MDESTNEIDLTELLGALLKRIKFIILITLVLGALAFGYAKFVLPLKYTSSISMYVKNTDGTSKDQVALGDINASKSLVSTYIVILQNDAVIDQIGEKIIEEYGADELEDYLTINYDKDDKPYVVTSSLRNCISMSAEQDTEVMLITVTTKSAALSVSICNAMEEIGPKEIKRVTQAGSVETIGAAKLPTGPSGPNVRRYTLIGLILGFIISAAIVIIGKLLDTTIRTGDDIKTRFDYPILGEIPDIEAKETKGGYYK
ncbi:MAG: lipopolysaccharide biosynthesis protein [Ruminococcus sp.]|nr:lipopolysaccharide biosynthesis protein [Ruminococcus sp.]